MSIEDRVRRMLAHAVTTEPPPTRAPLEQIRRRRRRRPLIATAVALVLLLAATVVFTGIREHGTPPTAPPTTLVPRGWKQFHLDDTNYSFRYPPDWVVKWYDPAGLLVLPPEAASIPLPLKPGTHLPFYVNFQQTPEYFGNIVRRASTGRLPGGQAYDESTGPDDAGRTADTYAFDWGRFCDPGGVTASCGAHSVMATVAGKPPLWDRYHAAATMIVRSVAPLRATTPSVGDRTRPACRLDQWQLGIPTGWDFHGRSWTIHGGVRYLGNGPACHLRLTLQATVERVHGSQVQIPGTPATTVIEGDLPEDGGHNDDTGHFASNPPTTALDWVFSWENWCRQPIGQLRVRITAGGRSGVVETPAKEDYGNCKGLSRTAPWRIVPGP